MEKTGIEYSYGVIPLKITENGSYQVFIIQHRSGNHWSFPKGHPEFSETIQQTAERELFEETGLKIDKYLCDSKLYSQSYLKPLKNGKKREKTVQFYAALVKGEIQT